MASTETELNHRTFQASQFPGDCARGAELGFPPDVAPMCFILHQKGELIDYTFHDRILAAGTEGKTIGWMYRRKTGPTRDLITILNY